MEELGFVARIFLSNQNDARYILVSFAKMSSPMLLLVVAVLLKLMVFDATRDALHNFAKYNENMCGKLLFAYRGISLGSSFRFLLFASFCPFFLLMELSSYFICKSVLCVCVFFCV